MMKFSASAGVERAEALCKQADVIAALTLEVLKGTTRAFDSSKFLVVLDSMELWLRDHSLR